MKKTVPGWGHNASWGQSFLPFRGEAQRVSVDEENFMRYWEEVLSEASERGPIARDHEVVPGSTFDGYYPLGRMALALRNRMAEEGELDKFPAVAARILALIRLIGDGSLKQWAISRPQDPGHLYYPDAIVFAAAISPLDDDLAFRMDLFENCIEERLGGMNRGRFIAWLWEENIQRTA